MSPKTRFILPSDREVSLKAITEDALMRLKPHVEVMIEIPLQRADGLLMHVVTVIGRLK